ncbi:MAG: 3-oxoacyl-[acyl-carrier-protein] synthase 2 [Candidatus Binatia bacterium]|nr:MAG: 3-oxoacyl-[acyl-carrier-protein] synthase 2 [Candidatus Binatia bacterium]
MDRNGRRVVVTGLGLLTPLGRGVEENWRRVCAGESGIRRIERFDPADLPVKIAGELPAFEAGDVIDRRDAKRLDLFSQYALVAADEAVRDAGGSAALERPETIASIVGVGFGGIATVEDGVRSFYDSGMKRVSAFFIPRLLANMAPAHVAMKYGMLGENFAVVSACASGGHAVGEAFRRIRAGLQEAAIAGGVEAPITPLTVAGFAAMRALSTRNDEPSRASRPFDRERDGFVLAEGAGMLFLETLERATARGARIYGEIVGYGANCDAYHLTAPAPEGRGAAECMRRALADAGVEPEEVGYINAHGTSTPLNDQTETTAIKHVFGAHAYRLAVSSTKSMIGHTLGAAGAIEAAYTVLALHHGVLPPTINYEHPDPECDLDYVPNVARPSRVEVALSNAFGFGGTNCTLVFRRWQGRGEAVRFSASS